MRWEIIEQSVDCRTDDEKDPNSANYISKSRYSTVNRYISNHEYVKDFHNDSDFKKVCPDLRTKMLEGGLDSRLATHVASLFIRSPVPVYEKELAFPCCQKEEAEEILEHIAATKQSPAKVRKNPLLLSSSHSSGGVADEETKSGNSSDRDSYTSCSSLIGEIDDKDLAGVCTAWFLKCPPIGGNSHFENI